MENFRPAFIKQKDVAILMSENGKPIGAYAIRNLIESGALPEPITKKVSQGTPKMWSVEELCDKLRISEDRLFETIRKTH